MSERAIPTKRHFDSLQCLTNALHKKSFYLGSPGSSAPDESTCLGICAWPRWLYLPLFLPPLETGSRLSVPRVPCTCAGEIRNWRSIKNNKNQVCCFNPIFKGNQHQPSMIFHWRCHIRRQIEIKADFANLCSS